MVGAHVYLINMYYSLGKKNVVDSEMHSWAPRDKVCRDAHVYQIHGDPNYAFRSQLHFFPQRMVHVYE